MYLDTAKSVVINYIRSKLESVIHEDDLHIVSASKILLNWKVLINTRFFYNTYYEVTFNANTNETTIDVYQRIGYETVLVMHKD